MLMFVHICPLTLQALGEKSRPQFVDLGWLVSLLLTLSLSPLGQLILNVHPG